jgi:hypothetical protein
VAHAYALPTGLFSFFVETSMPKVITKRIYEWADLSRRLQRSVKCGHRLRNDWDRRAHKLLERQAFDGAIAKLGKRLWAVGTQSVIQLHYVRTSRATGNMEVSLAATVHPASGGRTQYRIPNGVNGWCANKHLPMNARDRESGTSTRTHWYVGGNGVWRPGIGDYYPDVGPRCCNDTLKDVIALLEAGEGKPPQAWRHRAARFARSVSRAVRPFGDILVRYELIGVASSERRSMTVAGHSDQAYSTFTVNADYGVRIRLKSPSKGKDHTADFCAVVTGPFAVIDGSPQIWFAVEKLLPQGHRSHSLASRAVNQSSWIVTLKPGRVIALARDWAAANVRIPIA